MNTSNIRNIAIIAHVDHGKTTLVDHLLKQSNTFASHQSEMNQTTIMDKGDLERERGVTITAKNTAINWQDHKINILDTPGHADFAGEVERVLHMADGCLLLVDAAEGVLSQTKYVLGLALKHQLKIIVVVNKVDRTDQRATEVLEEINDLFLELADNSNQLEFPVIYAIARSGIAGTKTDINSDNSLSISNSENLQPLFKTIIQEIPSPTGETMGGFQLQVASIDHDTHKGRIVIGRIHRGTIKTGDALAIMHESEKKGQGRAEYIYTFKGLTKEPVDTAGAGQIIALTGFADAQIGDTISSLNQLEGLPSINISDPTIQIQISASNSPLVGQDGKFSTARQIGQRLIKELETNVSLKIKTSGSSDSFTVAGRGEMHLSVLIETMRREGYEFSVSRPQVIYKNIDEKSHEPFEKVFIEVPESHSGTVINMMGLRKGEMTDMKNLKTGIRFEFKISTKNLIGLRSELMTKTSGMGIINSQFIGYEPRGPETETARNGAIVAMEAGKALAYGLQNVQKRAITFIDPGEQVYPGMIVGQNSRHEDIYMNVCKGKKLTNMRAASGDDIIKLAPKAVMTLEQCLTFIADDELIEVTPLHLRLRKKNLDVKH